MTAWIVAGSIWLVLVVASLAMGALAGTQPDPETEMDPEQPTPTPEA